MIDDYFTHTRTRCFIGHVSGSPRLAGSLLDFHCLLSLKRNLAADFLLVDCLF